MAVVVAMSLSGCHRGEDTLTGPQTGANVLTGQVITVGDLSGSSPAGINVTCSGEVAVTDGSGQFAFMGLSATASRMTTFASGRQLSFTRGDGINATTSVAAGTSSVGVQLQKSQATIVSTGQSKREIEGLVKEISDTSITVDDASTGGPVTAKITTDTVIRKGNKTLKPSDLKTGDRVHVKTTGSGAALTATEIIVQNQ